MKSRSIQLFFCMGDEKSGEERSEHREGGSAEDEMHFICIICIPCCSITEYVACMRTNNNNNIILLCTHMQVVRGHSPEQIINKVPARCWRSMNAGWINKLHRPSHRFVCIEKRHLLRLRFSYIPERAFICLTHDEKCKRPRRSNA